MKPFWENVDPRGYCTDILEFEKGFERWLLKELLFQSWMNAKADIIVETFSSVYGLSLKQDHEDYVDNELIKEIEMMTEMIIETLPKGFAESFPEDLRQAIERLVVVGSEFFNENKSSIGMFIVLEYTDRWGAIHRRFWGILEIKWGDPFYKPVVKRVLQLTREQPPSIEHGSPVILELKCQRPANEETSISNLEETSEEGNNNPELEELMRMIEQDVISLNKSYGKLKASIVGNNASISPEYKWEAKIFALLTILGGWVKFASPFKTKITSYGEIRVEDDPLRIIIKKCFWGLDFVLISSIRFLYFFIHSICSSLFSATLIGHISRSFCSYSLLLYLESLSEADFSGRWTMFASTIGALIGSQPLLEIRPNGQNFLGLSLFLFVLIRCLFFVCLQLFSATLIGMALRRFLLHLLLNYFESFMSILFFTFFIILQVDC
jgi:hypothetical protein